MKEKRVCRKFGEVRTLENCSVCAFYQYAIDKNTGKEIPLPCEYQRR